MAQRIIINADDLGLCASVNRAIFDVFTSGNLSSATLMVAMPGTMDAVSRLKVHQGLVVGLHFCLTEGEPLIGPSTLCGADGKFRDRAALVRAIYRNQVHPEDITSEFRKQLEMLFSFGIVPTHVDSHQHVHMIPAIFRSMKPVLYEFDLPLRLVDPPSIVLAMDFHRPAKLFKRSMNRWFARGIRRDFKGRTNDTLISIHDLSHPGPYHSGTYQRLVAASPSDSIAEIMVHPYILHDDVLRMYEDKIDLKMPVLKRCEAEYVALSQGPIFDDQVLIDYSQL